MMWAVFCPPICAKKLSSSSAKVPAVDYKQPNKTQWQPSECLQLRVFGQPPVGDDITFSETGRTVPLKTLRQTAKESRGIGLKTCPEKTEAEILSVFLESQKKGKKRHRTPTHQFIWGFLSLVSEVFSIVDGSVWFCHRWNRLWYSNISLLSGIVIQDPFYHDTYLYMVCIYVYSIHAYLYILNWLHHWLLLPGWIVPAWR